MNNLMMMTSLLKSAGIVILSSVLLTPLFFSNEAAAQLVPEWVKNTAKWFGDGLISEDDFLNAIKFLIDNDIIILDSEKETEISDSEKETEISESDPEESALEYVIIPDANSLQSNRGSYMPFNLEIESGTTVVWLNSDNFGHTVQSQDAEGNAVDYFSSSIIQPGDSFEHGFFEAGEYPYYCTYHPWRVGLITVR